MVIGKWSHCLYLYLQVFCITFHSVLLRREWVSTWVGIWQWAILNQTRILTSFVWMRKQNTLPHLCSVYIWKQKLSFHTDPPRIWRDISVNFILHSAERKPVGIFCILNVLIDKHWILCLLSNLLKLYRFCLMCIGHIYIWWDTEHVM